jgi:hypothetical protein
LKPPQATAQQQAQRSAKGPRGDTQATNPLRDGVCGGEKRFNPFLAEFTDAWLSAAGPAGGLPQVTLIFLLQSSIVRCGEVGRIETAAAEIY